MTSTIVKRRIEACCYFLYNNPEIEYSKHFITVISNLDYLNSYWVELEMKTFRHEMVERRKKNANFIFVVTNDVFQEILLTNKQCLPIKYLSYEIIKVEDYKNSIISYLR